MITEKNGSPDKWVKSIFIIFTVFFVGLCVFTAQEYNGSTLVYLLFSATSFTLVFMGFRKNAIFFDTFIAVLLLLGFWLKFSVRIVFFDGIFHNAVGHFDYTPEAFDKTLLISSCAFLALILASFLREKFIFNYASETQKSTLFGLNQFYQNNRAICLVMFVALVVFVAITNIYFGFYQRGSVTKTILPYGLNGIYKWLLFFGLASFSALILWFEYYEGKRNSYLVSVIVLFETFVSNVSLLSRGMLLNASSLGYGLLRTKGASQIKSSLKFVTLNFLVFAFLFLSSVLVVNYLRIEKFSGENNSRTVSTISKVMHASNTTKILFLDRWVGIEGLMAISSYPNLGWDIWKKAWSEKFTEKTTSFYDRNIIKTPYVNVDKTKNHFISLPGVIAFCFYPASYIFLFTALLLIGLFSAFLELIVYKLGGKNKILCALLSQVVAYRFAHFGYVPAQSYLLFGSILLNISLIYLGNQILQFIYQSRAGAIVHNPEHTN